MALTALAVLDGTVLPADEATIGVTDLGLLRGDGVFEVISVYEGKLFAMEDHLRRMANSAQNLRLEIDLGAVTADVDALLAEAGPVTGAIRYFVTRGGRRVGLIEAVPEEREPLILASIEYVPPRVLDGVKSLSYGGNMLATRLAVEKGATEALLVTPHGRVLEGPTSSIFVSLDGETLVTPPLSDRVLDSITRRRLLALLPFAREEVVTREELRGAREAFFASTTREVQPVARIDDDDLPAVPGPLTQQAADAFAAHIRDELGA
ncbi:MAG: 4-amino-4-deoxychorismate lyase [Conexibacter sp.]|nr:4-amino-4-deoxychorismate lyase [Conexibacter sp.]